MFRSCDHLQAHIFLGLTLLVTDPLFLGSPRKIFVVEDGRMTETCSAVKWIVETYDINVA
jgi:hypothetical protein